MPNVLLDVDASPKALPPKRRFATAYFLLSLVACPIQADQITLKNGLELSGNITTQDHEVTVRTPVKLYRVATQQLRDVAPPPDNAELPVTYALDQTVPKNARRIESMLGVADVGEFDLFGRRRAVLSGPAQKSFTAIQAITEIHPTHLVLEGLNCQWTTSLAISEVNPARLIEILRKKTADDALPDHLKLATFLTQARLYVAARDQLQLMTQRFPNATDMIDERRQKLDEQFRRDALAVARRSLETGQRRKARKIVEEMFRSAGEESAPWKELLTELDQTDNRIAQARDALERARAQTPSSQLGPDILTILDEIATSVSPANVDRLMPMLALADQADTSPASLLALAASGWAAGPNLASPDVDQSARWARGRTLLRAALDEVREDSLEERLDALRAADLDAELIAALARRLIAAPVELSTEPIRIAESAACPAYRVLLPAEYDRTADHPMVIAIPGVEVSADRLLDFWSYVRDQINALIVVPDFLLEPGKGYEYSLEEHARYRQLLSDVRRRFAVDSDRVFLTGHEVGAFAAFDLAISHPDELAGLISFGGLPRFYSQYYWRNVGHLPIYAVDGALNGDNPILMNEWSQRAFRRGEPIISVIYLGRGNGGFEAELPTIVDWMNRQRRQPYPDVIESASARHSDRRFYWVEMDAFMPNATIPPQLFDKKKGVKPGRIDARIEQGATLRMDTVSLESIHIHLSPDLVAFDDPNLTVKVNRKVVHAGPIRPDLTTLVRVLRDTGDNRRLVFKTLTTPTR